MGIYNHSFAVTRLLKPLSLSIHIIDHKTGVDEI
jgi:hypothetical protein